MHEDMKDRIIVLIEEIDGKKESDRSCLDGKEGLWVYTCIGWI